MDTPKNGSICSEKSGKSSASSDAGSDLEQHVSTAEHMLRLGIRLSDEQGIVWRSDCKDHPRNWSSRRKFYDVFVVAMLEFYVTLISTTGPSAAAAAKNDYHAGELTSLVAFSLMYQLGQAVGGLIVPPFSESFGRRTPYIVSGIAFALFSLLMALVPSIAMIYIGRFVTGFASAVPAVVLAGSIEDMFNARRRVWLVLLWSSLATAGLTVGPMYGVYISAAKGWRWIYYSSAIGSAILTVLICFIRESRPSLLLARKVAALRQVSGEDFKYENHDAVADRAALLEIILVRPVRLLVSEPLVILVTTLFAVSLAIIYLFTESLVAIYQTIGLSQTTASLPFLAIGLGGFFSILPRFQDLRVAKRRKQRGEHLEPEDKLTGFPFAVLSLAIGLWWFAWTIPPAVTDVPWIVPTLGLVFVGFAVNEVVYTLSAYLADAYTTYAGSAFAGLAFGRAIVAGLMPLVAYELYGEGGLDANLATTVVAAVATLFGVAPIILLRYGKAMRSASKFAKCSLEVHERTQIEMD